MILKDKVCIVTGAGGGIGEGIAKTFAKVGAIVIVATIIPDEGQSVVKEIMASGGRACYLHVDVSQKESVLKMVAEVIARYDKIDVLVNNAGVTKFKPLALVSEEDWSEVIDIDLKGVFLCSKYVSQHMREQKKGSIINISSNHVYATLENAELYTAAKGGVSAMTRSLALSLGGDNIRVNSICPGFTDTPHHGTWVNNRKGSPAEVEAVIQSLHAVNRICKPEDIGHLAIYLGSDYSECMTGAELVIDGGLSVSLFTSTVLEAKE